VFYIKYDLFLNFFIYCFFYLKHFKISFIYKYFTHLLFVLLFILITLACK